MRILLVEDETKVSSFVARGLMAERFAVDVIADGQSGLELATTYHYDLVILDLMLPKMDGTQVLRRLRSQNVNVPVLILTARDAVADKVGNFEAGADDYLTKPFAFAELLVPNRAIDRLIFEGSDDAAIERAAVEQGMRPIFDSGLLAVIDGDTTIEEVVRCIRSEA